MKEINLPITIEDNRALEKFFAHHKKYSERIKETIYANLLFTLNRRPQKIKTVKGLKYRGKTIFEYKIVLDGSFACRLAYIIRDEDILVFFLSDTLRKLDYVKLVENLPGVRKV